MNEFHESRYIFLNPDKRLFDLEKLMELGIEPNYDSVQTSLPIQIISRIKLKKNIRLPKDNKKSTFIIDLRNLLDIPIKKPYFHSDFLIYINEGDTIQRINEFKFITTKKLS